MGNLTTNSQEKKRLGVPVIKQVTQLFTKVERKLLLCFVCVIRYHEKKHAVYMKMLSDQRSYADLMRE